MKNEEEPSTDSRRGNPSSTEETTGSLSRPGPTVAAQVEQPALSLFPETLMEAVVDSTNIERAWKNVRANRGAAGPDGITITEFPDWFRPRWTEIRQQLLDGTYQPNPVRRKTIDKPDGGQRLLGIPNIIDRLIQQAIVQVLTPLFDPHFSATNAARRCPATAFDPIARLTEQPSKSSARFVVAIGMPPTSICPNSSIESNTMS